MVGETVVVESKPAAPDLAANKWTSDGTGTYNIAAADASDLQRGCRITINLKDTALEFADSARIKDIITKYSNFVNFPIKIDGEVINTVKAIWTESPSEVSEEEYQAFYRFQAGGWDEPAFRLHYRADAPIDLKVLFYVPSFHTEKWGEGRMEPGVSLYSRKVLIEKECPDILPDWMRFIKGVVDSEDLPLSISREKPQVSGWGVYCCDFLLLPIASCCFLLLPACPTRVQTL